MLLQSDVSSCLLGLRHGLPSSSQHISTSLIVCHRRLTLYRPTRSLIDDCTVGLL